LGVSGALSTKFVVTSLIDLPPTRSKKLASWLFTSMPPIGTGTLASYHCFTNTSEAAWERITNRYCEPFSFSLAKIGEKSAVCGSKNSAMGTSSPAASAPFFKAGTMSWTHLAFSPRIEIRL
jgi:hypothetical protein